MVILRCLLVGDGDGVGVVLDDAGEHGDGERDVADDDDGGDAGRQVAAPVVEAGVAPAQRLEQRPRAVEQVDAEGDVGDDVEDRHRKPRERWSRL
jgi:hypothetical protein